VRYLLVEAVEQPALPGSSRLMFKSREAKAWEAKVQHLIDMVVLHHSEAIKSCKADNNKQEQRHALQVEKLMHQLARLTDAGSVPAGAKLPKLPKVT
jgi:hypothetical protein